jgi:hypothetical protein
MTLWHIHYHYNAMLESLKCGTYTSMQCEYSAWMFSSKLQILCTSFTEGLNEENSTITKLSFWVNNNLHVSEISSSPFHSGCGAQKEHHLRFGSQRLLIQQNDQSSLDPVSVVSVHLWNGWLLIAALPYIANMPPLNAQSLHVSSWKTNQIFSI